MQGRACGQPGRLQRFACAWDSSGHGSEAEMGFPVPAGTPGTPQHLHTQRDSLATLPAAGCEGGSARPQALTPHPGPSHVHPGAGCGFSAGSQLSARAESPARGREHREPPSSWPKGRQRPGTLQDPGSRQRALGAWLEQGWSCTGGGGTLLNPTGPWGGGHRCLRCTLNCPGHRTGWSRGSWAR